MDGVIVGIFVAWTLLATWIAFLGGAEWLEDTWLGDFLLGVLFEVPWGSPLIIVKVGVVLIWVMVFVGLLFTRNM